MRDELNLSNLTEEQSEILREAESRGSLIDGHPDLKDRSPESPRDTRYQPIHYDHTGGPAIPPKPVDPRSMGPQPQPNKSGWGGGADQTGTVNDEQWKQKFWGGKK